MSRTIVKSRRISIAIAYVADRVGIWPIAPIEYSAALGGAGEGISPSDLNMDESTPYWVMPLAVTLLVLLVSMFFAKLRGVGHGLPVVAVDEKEMVNLTHDYITKLHEQHGEAFLAKRAGERTSSLMIYASNPATATFILKKKGMFDPIR